MEKLAWSQAQVERLEKIRKIPYGGIKFSIGLILFVLWNTLSVFAGLQFGQEDNTPFVQLIIWIWIVINAISCFAFIAYWQSQYHPVQEPWPIDSSQKAWPFGWLTRYWRNNVKGWYVVYYSCVSHNHVGFGFAQKGRRREFWFHRQEHDKTADSPCQNLYCVVPLGGWFTKAPYCDSTYGQLPKKTPTDPQFNTWSWKLIVDVVYTDPRFQPLRIHDYFGNRVKASISLILKWQHERPNSSLDHWTEALYSQRNDARSAADDLLSDLMETERQIHESRRFVQSSQAKKIRLLLVQQIITRLRELSTNRVRPFVPGEVKRYEKILRDQSSDNQPVSFIPTRPPIA